MLRRNERQERPGRTGRKIGASGATQRAPAVPHDMGMVAARRARRPADGMHGASRAAHAGFT
ncbi:hypothetical protein CFB43_00395 [Burkholderia sp. AU15512]|nr:hypothetical protein CFB43_00395 [Burkholderia sp. AU15512]